MGALLAGLPELAPRVSTSQRGDGGTLREVLKHPVKKACIVEIDKKVIDLCEKYMPSICKNSFHDKRSEIIIDDGAKFVEKYKGKFDVIIVDSSDPIGPATILFEKKFYKDLSRIMKPSSITKVFMD